MDLAIWASRKGVAVSMENPKNSYLWTYMDTAEDSQDVVFSPCRFGGEFRKPTRIRCWNWFPTTLDKDRNQEVGSVGTHSLTLFLTS